MSVIKTLYIIIPSGYVIHANKTRSRYERKNNNFCTEKSIRQRAMLNRQGERKNVSRDVCRGADNASGEAVKVLDGDSDGTNDVIYIFVIHNITNITLLCIYYNKYKTEYYLLDIEM